VHGTADHGLFAASFGLLWGLLGNSRRKL
jgi:hypothetical protein